MREHLENGVLSVCLETHHKVLPNAAKDWHNIQNDRQNIIFLLLDICVLMCYNNQVAARTAPTIRQGNEKNFKKF